MRGELMMINSSSGGWSIREHSNDANIQNLVFGGCSINKVQDAMPLWLLKMEQVQRLSVSTASFIDAVSQFYQKGKVFLYQQLVGDDGVVIGIQLEECHVELSSTSS